MLIVVAFLVVNLEMYMFLVVPRGSKIFIVLLRSHVNSRCFVSRYLFRFLGHNSEPHHAFWTKIGGNLPLSLPELSIPIRDLFESDKP